VAVTAAEVGAISLLTALTVAAFGGWDPPPLVSAEDWQAFWREEAEHYRALANEWGYDFDVDEFLAEMRA
jgi:hypothetical protein